MTTVTGCRSLLFILDRGLHGIPGELGQGERGRQLGEDTLARCRRVLGENHPHTLRAAYTLAAALGEAGQDEQACQLGEDTLTRMRRVLGEDHPDTLRAAHRFGAALATRGKEDQAPQREK